MNEIKLNSFPSNYAQALALIYLKNCDLTNKSPEEILHIYREALDRINAEQDKINEENSTDIYCDNL